MRFLIPLLLFFNFTILAQQHDNVWLTGYANNDFDLNWGGSRIDFMNSPPDTAYEFRELNFYLTNASVCDKEGNLLFYTNGTAIANANHEIMDNGDNIGPNPHNQSWYDNGLSLHQGAIVLPQPNNDSIFFLLHEERASGGPLGFTSRVPNLYYSKVNMNSNNGLGLVTEKNKVIIHDTLDIGKVTAAKHGNGRDWWTIVPEFFTNKYYRTLLTPDGVLPVEEQIVGDSMIAGTGQAVFSPDGSKYARISLYRFDEPAILSLYDFDRCEGLLSNQQVIEIDTLENGSINPFGGVVFSPNSRFLYHINYTTIIQYDTWVDDLSASLDTVAIYDDFLDEFSGFGTRFRQGALGPNGKIYIATTANTKYLHVVHNPNEEGLACNVAQHELKLPTLNNRTLPNFPNYRLYAKPDSPCDTIRALADFDIDGDLYERQFIDMSSRHPDSWQWTFGDGGVSEEQNPIYTYNATGQYEVCLTVTNEGGSDTICKLLDITTSTNEVLSIIDLSIAPNPVAAQSVLTIQFDKSFSGIIDILDSTGRLIVSKNERKALNTLIRTPRAKGVYLMRFTDFSGKRVVRRVVVY